jgi:hypothetical protein
MCTSLAGRTVLIVEDEPLIALDIVTSFRAAGASAVAARSLAEAHRHIEQKDLSAAVRSTSASAMAMPSSSVSA